jgi:hypothetical protein
MRIFSWGKRGEKDIGFLLCLWMDEVRERMILEAIILNLPFGSRQMGLHPGLCQFLSCVALTDHIPL